MANYARLVRVNHSVFFGNRATEPCLLENLVGSDVHGSRCSAIIFKQFDPWRSFGERDGRLPFGLDGTREHRTPQPGARMKTARRLYWSAARFIPAPWPGEAPKVFANAIPKSGTHLLERALCLHPQISRVFRKKLFSANIAAHGGWEKNIARIARGRMLLVHADYDSATHSALCTHDVRTILMVRDPRAIVLSQARYILGNARHEFHRHVRGAISITRSTFAFTSPSAGGGMTFIETCCRYSAGAGTVMC